jgi:hypothetical protein
MTDNPHYVTAEEAEEKTCPYDAKNWGTCMGSQCMAWRWRPAGHQYLMKGYVLPLPIVPEQPMTHGFCGMVRT